MIYFSEKYIDFFGNLTLNNNKAWFDEHRSEYEQYVREPFKVFATDLLIAMKKVDKDIEVEGRKTVMRINKDVRFSKDKTPYRTDMGSGFGVQKSDDFAWPRYFISIGVLSGVQVIGGIYMPDTAMKNQIQKSMAESPEEFMKIVTATKFKKHFGQVDGDRNKRVPKNWGETLKINPYVLNKSWTYGKEYPVDLALSNDLLSTILADYRAAMQFQNYFKDFCTIELTE